MPRLVTTNMSINNGDVERRYHSFSAYCQEAQPDIIAVQEISADHGFAALQGLTAVLGDGYRFYYEPIYPGQENTQGVGVVTRLSVNQNWVFDPECGRNKFQVLELLAESNRRLLLANIHLEAHLLLDLRRKRKLKRLVGELDSEAPQVLAGDFNAIPRWPSIRYLSRDYRSAHFMVHGAEPTHTYPTDLGEELLQNGDASPLQLFMMKAIARACQRREDRRPSGLPRMVIDHVFLNGLVRALDARVVGHEAIDQAFSDHLGLQVDFAF